MTIEIKFEDHELLDAKDFHDALFDATDRVLTSAYTTLSGAQRIELISRLVEVGYTPRLLRSHGIAKRENFKGLVSESEYKRLPLGD